MSTKVLARRQIQHLEVRNTNDKSEQYCHELPKIYHVKIGLGESDMEINESSPSTCVSGT